MLSHTPTLQLFIAHQLYQFRHCVLQLVQLLCLLHATLRHLSKQLLWAAVILLALRGRGSILVVLLLLLLLTLLNLSKRVWKWILTRERRNMAIYFLKHPVLHRVVVPLALELDECFRRQVKPHESGEWLYLVGLLQIVVVGPINLRKNDLVTIPPLEIVSKLIPLGLKYEAPVALLHVEVKHNELVLIQVH